MSIEEAKFLLSVINMVATFSVFIYIALTRKSQVNETRINKFEEHVSKDFQDVKTRVTKLENQPNHDQGIVDIHKRLNGISREVSSLSGEFKQTSEAVKRIHDYMINKG